MIMKQIKIRIYMKVTLTGKLTNTGNVKNCKFLRNRYEIFCHDKFFARSRFKIT